MFIMKNLMPSLTIAILCSIQASLGLNIYYAIDYAFTMTIVIGTLYTLEKRAFFTMYKKIT